MLEHNIYLFLDIDKIDYYHDRDHLYYVLVHGHVHHDDLHVDHFDHFDYYDQIGQIHVHFDHYNSLDYYDHLDHDTIFIIIKLLLMLLNGIIISIQINSSRLIALIIGCLLIILDFSCFADIPLYFNLIICLINQTWVFDYFLYL